MTRQRPMPLLVMALLGLVLGGAYLIWLITSQLDILTYLVNAGLGDAKSISDLRKNKLGSPEAIYTTVITFFLELALTFMLVWTALGLLNLRPWARWAAVFYAIFMIVVGVTNVILAVFVLGGVADRLWAVIARGAIVLYAIALWGVMFLPTVTAVYTDGAPPPSYEEEELEEEDLEPEPAPPRRRVKAGHEDEEL